MEFEHDGNFTTTDIETVCQEEDNLVLNSNLELDLQIEQMIEKNEGLWQCKVCDKIMQHKRDIVRHAEAHIEGVSHACGICNKTLSTKNSLRKHISTIHSDLLVTCSVCGKSGMKKNDFTRHKAKGCNESSI